MERPSLFVGMSARAWDIAREIECAARCRVPVLLTGETGVGKKVVARTIHEQSRRPAPPLVTLNCSGQSEQSFDSELSGRIPHGGTLLINEPGALDLRMQAALLRFLERGVDGRVISVTRRPLFAAVGAKTFLCDLYYRLNVMHIEIPPLRARREDVPVLLDGFLHEAMPGQVPAEVSGDAVQHLMEYYWPGNVRELKAVAERLVLTCAGGRIEVSVLPPEIVDDRRGATRPVREIFARLVRGQDSFWPGVYEPFMAHDLSRRDLQELVRFGLEHTNGDYRKLAVTLRLPEQDYRRFLGFLREYQCHLPLTRFRSARAALRSRSRDRSASA